MGIQSAQPSIFVTCVGELPDKVEYLFYQMRVKVRAEQASLSAINCESGQIVLRNTPTSEDKDHRRLPDLGPGIRGARKTYWCAFGSDDDWRKKLLEKG